MISEQGVSTEHATIARHALGDVRRVQLRENLDLLLDIFYLILRTLEVDYLNRYCLLRSLVVSVGGDEASEIGALALKARTLYKPLRTNPCLRDERKDERQTTQNELIVYAPIRSCLT
jgi:hypothetical protein